jgi:hypothetical protein
MEKLEKAAFWWLRLLASKWLQLHCFFFVYIGLQKAVLLCTRFTKHPPATYKIQKMCMITCELWSHMFISVVTDHWTSVICRLCLVRPAPESCCVYAAVAMKPCYLWFCDRRVNIVFFCLPARWIESKNNTEPLGAILGYFHEISILSWR